MSKYKIVGIVLFVCYLALPLLDYVGLRYYIEGLSNFFMFLSMLILVWYDRRELGKQVITKKLLKVELKKSIVWSLGLGAAAVTPIFVGITIFPDAIKQPSGPIKPTDILFLLTIVYCACIFYWAFHKAIRAVLIFFDLPLFKDKK